MKRTKNAQKLEAKFCELMTTIMSISRIEEDSQLIHIE